MYTFTYLLFKYKSQSIIVFSHLKKKKKRTGERMYVIEVLFCVMWGRKLEFASLKQGSNVQNFSFPRIEVGF